MKFSRVEAASRDHLGAGAQCCAARPNEFAILVSNVCGRKGDHVSPVDVLALVRTGDCRRVLDIVRADHTFTEIPSHSTMDTTCIRTLLIAAISMLSSGCFHSGPKGPTPPPVQGKEHTQFAMKYIDLALGTGADAAPDKCYYVHYTGWLTDGKKFDSSHDTTSSGKARTPLPFQQGKKSVITGWDQGFEGMKVGGKRRLIIPYQLAYGVNGRPPVIPPKATLIFDVELMDVREGPAAPAPGTPPGTPPARCAPWS